jgi:tetratricopeptide (TPR) repeat protein
MKIHYVLLAGMIGIVTCLPWNSSGQSGMTGDFGNDSLMVIARFSQGRARMLYNQGTAALQAREVQKSIQLFTEAVSFDPRLAEAFYNRGIANLMMKNQVEAMLDFAEAIQIDPRPEFYYGRSVVLYSRGELTSSLSDMQRANQGDPPSPIIMNSIGILQYSLKNPAAALDAFSRVLRSDKTNREALNGCGIAYLSLGDTTNAMEQFSGSLELDSAQKDLLYLVGNLYLERKMFADAESTFRKSLLLDELDYRALTSMSMLSILQHNYDTAFYYSKSAINANPGYPPAWNTSGILFYLTKDYQRAEADLNMAVSLSPEFWKAYYNRALVRDMLRNDEGACEDLKKASVNGIREANALYRENCE